MAFPVPPTAFTTPDAVVDTCAVKNGVKFSVPRALESKRKFSWKWRISAPNLKALRPFVQERESAHS